MPSAWILQSAGSRNEVIGNVYAARIKHDVQDGIRNGVHATPKFYVDGQRIDGKLPQEGLADTVQAAVAAASGG